MEQEGLYRVEPPPNYGEALTFSVSAIVAAESRLEDVATVSSHTAPGLMAVFNRCLLDLRRISTRLVEFKLRYESAISYRRAEVLLDSDRILKQKELKPTSELREAVVCIDPEYINLQDKLNEVKTIHMMIVNKEKAFDNAFGAVKRIIQNNEYPVLRHSAGEATRPEPMMMQPEVKKPLQLPEDTNKYIDMKVDWDE